MTNVPRPSLCSPIFLAYLRRSLPVPFRSHHHSLDCAGRTGRPHDTCPGLYRLQRYRSAETGKRRKGFDFDLIFLELVRRIYIGYDLIQHRTTQQTTSSLGLTW